VTRKRWSRHRRTNRNCRCSSDGLAPVPSARVTDAYPSAMLSFVVFGIAPRTRVPIMLVMKTSDGLRPIASVRAFGHAPMCSLRRRRVRLGPEHAPTLSELPHVHPYARSHDLRVHVEPCTRRPTRLKRSFTRCARRFAPGGVVPAQFRRKKTETPC
jgi:hypothetical protein